MGKEREEKKKERRRGKRGEEYRYSIRAEVKSRTSGGGGKEGGGEKRSRKEDHKWRGRGAFDSKVETRRGAATSKRGRQGVLKT